ncbi:MAG: hypothetical protein JSU03_06160 [Bacteroidetes bacterium]|nr:hypothetical protein [Bacteroidota bacterium]MBS1756845.1 hypothetical protein [Bacteroidota bacterium]
MNKIKLWSLAITLLVSININAQSSLEPQPAPIANVKSAAKLQITAGASGYSKGLKISNAIIVSVDTTIRVSPKTAYLSIDMSGIIGTNMAEILNGKNSFWITDKNGKNIVSAERFLKQVKGTLESSTVSYTVKIPFKLKKDLSTPYTVRYLYESKDQQKAIDIVSTR